MMEPNNSIIKGGLPSEATARALVEEGKQYAIYIRGESQVNITLNIPSGEYRSEWLNPRTGEIDKMEVVKHRGGRIRLVSPSYIEDIALRIVLRVEG